MTFRRFSDFNFDISTFSAILDVRKTEMRIGIQTKVLLVDDSSTHRVIVRNLLTELGINDVDEASNGKDAIAKIHEKKYDLVISDWNMEPMNGQQLLVNVRAEKQFAKLPFILMTAESAVSKIVDAKNARVSSFINKPFNAGALETKILAIEEDSSAGTIL
jgi:two-component system chemotaxis response regulator CheY